MPSDKTYYIIDAHGGYDATLGTRKMKWKSKCKIKFFNEIDEEMCHISMFHFNRFLSDHNHRIVVYYVDEGIPYLIELEAGNYAEVDKHIKREIKEGDKVEDFLFSLFESDYSGIYKVTVHEGNAEVTRLHDIPAHNHYRLRDLAAELDPPGDIYWLACNSAIPKKIGAMMIKWKDKTKQFDQKEIRAIRCDGWIEQINLKRREAEKWLKDLKDFKGRWAQFKKPKDVWESGHMKEFYEARAKEVHKLMLGQHLVWEYFQGKDGVKNPMGKKYTYDEIIKKKKYFCKEQYFHEKEIYDNLDKRYEEFQLQIFQHRQDVKKATKQITARIAVDNLYWSKPGIYIPNISFFE